MIAIYLKVIQQSCCLHCYGFDLFCQRIQHCMFKTRKCFDLCNANMLHGDYLCIHVLICKQVVCVKFSQSCRITITMHRFCDFVFHSRVNVIIPCLYIAFLLFPNGTRPPITIAYKVFSIQLR